MPSKVRKADIPKSAGSLGRKPFFSRSTGKGGWRNLIGPAQLRGAVGGPGIGGELRFSELLNGVLGGLADSVEGNTLVSCWKSLEQFRGTKEEGGGGAEAASVDTVRGFAMVVLQVDVGAGELDERFVVGVERSFRSEPDMLEDVVGGVVLLRVEEAEIFDVARMPTAVGGYSGEARGEFFVFAHGAGPTNHTGRGADRAKAARAGLAARIG